MEAVAPWAVNVQLKTIINHPDGTRKEIDLERLAGILQRTRYRGYVAMEYEEPGDVWEACQQWIPRIRAALQTQPTPVP
jgi:hydroxypyruvate isomerase